MGSSLTVNLTASGIEKRVKFGDEPSCGGDKPDFTLIICFPNLVQMISEQDLNSLRRISAKQSSWSKVELVKGLLSLNLKRFLSPTIFLFFI